MGGGTIQLREGLGRCCVSREITQSWGGHGLSCMVAECSQPLGGPVRNCKGGSCSQIPICKKEHGWRVQLAGGRA